MPKGYRNGRPLHCASPSEREHSEELFSSLKKLDVYELRVCRETLCKPERTEGEIVRSFDTDLHGSRSFKQRAFVGQKVRGEAHPVLRLLQG